MSSLPVHFRDIKSFWKMLSSPSADSPSNMTNGTPDVEQAHHHELSHHHRQQQQCRGDEASSDDTCIESGSVYKPACELDGILGINALQASDPGYQIASKMDKIFSYITHRRGIELMRIWKDLVYAIESGNSSLQEELETRLASRFDTYIKTILNQSRINHLPRASKPLIQKFFREVRKKVGADVEYIEEDPSCYVSYGQHDVLDAAARRILEFSWVHGSLAMFKRSTTSGKHSDYIHFPEEVVLAIKMLMMLLVIIVFVYVPVIIPGLGVVSSQVGITILYGAFISLSCAVTTLTLEVNTALAAELAYAGVLGNVMYNKGT
ncbi:hypothetical protein GGI43DRAFT_23837 [Trichoderma evansii]